ncbi:cellulose binding domain-containing protein [Nocardiopsis sp. FIRDI 009]|uniref:pectate lyase family protein n=1 Tax=Nocardiopsis sp. FIRDI 009 TaxID=714197 RepID=UPI000E253037|nr:cellulose binding domain-containing protein [Nocardiopsis sp. FIRDI 009]
MSSDSTQQNPRRRARSRGGRRRALVLAAGATAVVGALPIGLMFLPDNDDQIEPVSAASSSTDCEADYRVTDEWNGGYIGEVTVSNTSGATAEGWTVTWTFPDGQEIGNAWNGEHLQDGSSVRVGDAGWNGTLADGATAAFGFQASFPDGNAEPTDVSCNLGAGSGAPAEEPADERPEEPSDEGPTADDPAEDPVDQPVEEATEEPAQEPNETPSTEPTAAPAAADQPIGWAGENGGTTGGEGGPTVTVSSGGELRDALDHDGPRIIQVSGSVELSGMTKVPSDTTVIGLDGAEIIGGGLNVSGVDNVIIRNIAFANWDDDAVNVQSGSTNVWIDHNSFTNGGDGAVDVKRESDFVTVSWNHFFDHHKTMLLGHSDGHTEDIGHLRVSYHHNFFDGSRSRHPRVRFGETVHVFNNYYVGNDYGVASTQDAGVLVEGNYFDDVEHPTHVGYGSSDDGRLVARDNVYAGGSGEPETSGDVDPVPYEYSLDPAEDVPAIVASGAGPGNI